MRKLKRGFENVMEAQQPESAPKSPESSPECCLSTLWPQAHAGIRRLWICTNDGRGNRERMRDGGAGEREHPFLLQIWHYQNLQLRKRKMKLQRTSLNIRLKDKSRTWESSTAPAKQMNPSSAIFHPPPVIDASSSLFNFQILHGLLQSIQYHRHNLIEQLQIRLICPPFIHHPITEFYCPAHNLSRPLDHLSS